MGIQTRTRSGPNRRKKPSIIHNIHGGVQAGIVSGALLIVLFVINSIAVSAAGPTGGASLICYPVQLLGFLFNGLLAGWRENVRWKVWRNFGFPHRNEPNYLATGALAGLVLAPIAAIVYVVVTAAVVSLVPPAISLIGPSVLALIAVDTIAATGLGLIGGFIYDRVFASHN